jgi:hypothetical protein
MGQMSLRGAEWYAGNDRNGYIHRAWMRRGPRALRRSLVSRKVYR